MPQVSPSACRLVLLLLLLMLILANLAICCYCTGIARLAGSSLGMSFCPTAPLALPHPSLLPLPSCLPACLPACVPRSHQDCHHRARVP
jgi:hypothetical protein